MQISTTAGTLKKYIRVQLTPPYSLDCYNRNFGFSMLPSPSILKSTLETIGIAMSKS